MDILIHSISGMALGTAVSSFVEGGILKKLGLFALAGFAGALPDVDAISLWSGFDQSIGSVFGLEYSGKEIYFSKLWYGHHAFMHSFFAAVFLALFGAFLAYLFRSRINRLSIASLRKYLWNRLAYILAYIGGFTLHLLEDMPTPHCVWGGVNFFWPSASYIGGSGQIWWWNNYDLFLIVTGVFGINMLVLLLAKLIKFNSRIITSIVFIVGFSMALNQISTRGFDFNYQGHTPKYQEFEQRSKVIQREVLGEDLYFFMQRIDNQLPINF